MIIEKDDAIKNLKKLSYILETKDSVFFQHDKLGFIQLDYGKAGNSEAQFKNGYGLSHIIARRGYEGKEQEDITSLLLLLTGNLKNSTVRSSEKQGRLLLEKNSILVSVSVEKFANSNATKWVVTGYDLNKTLEQKKESSDSIKTVSVLYGYLPEFSNVRKQVVAELHTILSQEKGLSSSVKKEKGGFEL